MGPYLCAHCAFNMVMYKGQAKPRNVQKLDVDALCPYFIYIYIYIYIYMRVIEYGNDRHSSCKITDWGLTLRYLGPPLLIWIDFNPSMDRDHMRCKRWDEITYSRLYRWSLGIHKKCHLTFYDGCNCNFSSMLELELIHVSEMALESSFTNIFS